MVERFEQNIGHKDDRQGVTARDLSALEAPCCQSEGDCDEEQ